MPPDHTLVSSRLASPEPTATATATAASPSSERGSSATQRAMASKPHEPDARSTSAQRMQAMMRCAAVTVLEAANEATHWRDHYRSRPYAGPGANHDDFGPAYAYALHAYRRHAGACFDALEQTLAADWPTHRGPSTLDWAQARPAVQDAWARLHGR